MRHPRNLRRRQPTASLGGHRPMFQPNRRRGVSAIARAVASMLMLGLPGCGSNHGTSPVSGLAHLVDGTPLPAGRVMLLGGDTGPSGAIQPDGTFRLGTFTTTDGARPGRYRVVILGAAEPDSRSYEEQLEHPERTPPSLIHPKYNRVETTDLEVEIVAGKNELEFSLEPTPRVKK